MQPSLSLKKNQLTRVLEVVARKKAKDKEWPRELNEKEMKDMLSTIVDRIRIQAKHLHAATRKTKNKTKQNAVGTTGVG